MSWRQPNPRGLDVEERGGDGAPPAGEGPPPLATWRKVVLGLVLAALALGLVVVVVARANGGDDDTTAASPTAPPTQVQTSAPPPPSSSQPPPLLNTGDDPDWNAMVRSMRAFDDWLRAHPRPELLGEWIRKESPAFNEGQAALRSFADGTWRYDIPYEPLSIERVSLISRHGPSAVVFVRYGPTGPTRVVDRTGKVVYEEPAKDARSVAWTVIRDPDGRWRFDKAEYL